MGMRRICVGTLVALVASIAAPASAKATPSLDCSKAVTVIEKRVCADEGLAEADRYLATVYNQRLAGTSDREKQQLIRDQRQWLKDLRSSCAGRDDPNRDFPWRGDMADCLAGEYDMRIDRLEQPLRHFVDLAEDAPKAVDVCTAMESLANRAGRRLTRRHALPVRDLPHFDHGLPSDLVDSRLLSQPEGADAIEELKNFGNDGWGIFAGRVQLWADKPESWVLWVIVGTAHNPKVSLFDPIPPSDKPGRFLGFLGEEGSGPFDWLFVRFRGRPYVLADSNVLDLDWSRNVCKRD